MHRQVGTKRKRPEVARVFGIREPYDEARPAVHRLLTHHAPPAQPRKTVMTDRTKRAELRKAHRNTTTDRASRAVLCLAAHEEPIDVRPCRYPRRHVRAVEIDARKRPIRRRQLDRRRLIGTAHADSSRGHPRTTAPIPFDRRA